jgi:hypothetical protein
MGSGRDVRWHLGPVNGIRLDVGEALFQLVGSALCLDSVHKLRLISMIRKAKFSDPKPR